ncbi:ABC transporter substrate-binding protein [Peterkaempfera sp. SMS 1(5)a]|uniref:ABC transporter substrate-binding protein n=1 Tax=Peterkaempfera podocarpi TaxID=3232308 RepID=UPI00366F4548
MKTRIALGTVLLIAATSACGAQSLNGSAKAADQPSATASLDQAPADDKAASVIDAITPDPALAGKVPGGVLKVTTSVGYPPMEIFAGDGKTPVGLDPSLARAIARKLGTRVTVANEDFNAQIPGVLTGRYDVILSSMSDTAERQAKVSFVDYVQAGAGMLVKKGNPAGIRTTADLCGKTISVVDNGSSLALANSVSAACKKSGKAAAGILKFAGDQEALLQVGNGRAQANITDYVVAASKAADPRTGTDAIAVPGTESPWGIGINKDNQQVVSAVQAALNSLIKSGDYGKILHAWGLDQLAVASAVVNGGK